MSEEDDFGPDPSPAADMAAMYRRHGIQVVPAFMPHEAKRPGEWKHPILKSWTEYQEALVPDETFQSWYGPAGKYRDRPNMGILTGRCSRNIFVIDLDAYKNAAATNWWNGVMAVHNNGLDLETAEQITGGEGRQKLFQAPNNWQAPTNRTSLNVDIRGQGGFAVLAPSMHHSGRQYAWVEGRSPEDIGIAMAPDWLLDEVRMLVEKYGGATAAGPGPKSRSNGEYQGADHDAFGNRTDGREEAMYRTVCGCLVHWHRENPTRPKDEESLAKSRIDYERYESRTRPQKDHPGLTLAQALDAEGRGWEVWQEKWNYLFKQWDTKVAAMAREAPPKQEAPSPEFGPDGTPKRLIMTSKEFADSLKPPAYIIDGIIQRGFLYSLTARTGHGKTAVVMRACAAIAKGEEFAGCATKKGSVLYLAGENPQDVRARYVSMCDELGIDTDTLPFYFIDGKLDIDAQLNVIRTEATALPDLRIIVIDTAAAYFKGDDQNSNAQLAKYAALLRELIKLPSLPTGIVNCHPVKNATQDNLIPMGGSAFLNEVDGNLTLWADDDRATTLHWQGKFRGPEFNAVSFELKEIMSEKVKDEHGSIMSSIMAVHMKDTVAERRQASNEEDQNVILRLMHAERRASFSTLAKNAGFTKSKVQRIIRRLKEDGLVKKFRNSRYLVTRKGCIAAGIKTDGVEDE